jgi:hypothetical protein
VRAVAEETRRCRTFCRAAGTGVGIFMRAVGVGAEQQPPIACTQCGVAVHACTLARCANSTMPTETRQRGVRIKGRAVGKDAVKRHDSMFARGHSWVSVAMACRCAAVQACGGVANGSSARALARVFAGTVRYRAVLGCTACTRRGIAVRPV